MTVKPILFERYMKKMKSIVKCIKFIVLFLIVYSSMIVFTYSIINGKIYALQITTGSLILLFSMVAIAVLVLIIYKYFKVSIENKPFIYFMKWLVLYTIVVLAIEITETAGLLPEESPLSLADDLTIPITFYFFAWSIRWNIHYLFSERITIRTIYEKIFQLIGLFMMIIPLVIFISSIITNGFLIIHNISFVIGDTIIALIAVIIGLHYFISLYLYEVEILYLDIADAFNLFIASFISLNLTDALENFVSPSFVSVMTMIKLISLVVMGLALIILTPITAKILSIMYILNELRIKIRKRQLSLNHILVDVDFDKALNAYSKILLFITSMVRHYDINTHDASIVLLMKPTSILPALLSSHTLFKDTKKIIAVVTKGVGLEKIAENRDEYYYIEPSAIRITFFINQLLKRDDLAKPLILIFDNISDFIYITDIKETYILLKNLTELDPRLIGIYIIVHGAHRRNEIALLKNIIYREALL